jgi:hypothetical protein
MEKIEREKSGKIKSKTKKRKILGYICKRSMINKKKTSKSMKKLR